MHRKLKLAAILAVLSSLVLIATASAVTRPEWHLQEGGAFPITFEGSVSESHIETNVAGTLLTCSGGKLRLVARASRFTPTSLRLTGCEVSLRYYHSYGQAEGEILLESNKELGYITQTSGKVAVAFEYLSTALYDSRGIEEFKLTGGLILPITPTNTATSTFGIKLNETRGKQEFTAWEPFELGKDEFRNAYLTFHINTWAEQAGLQTKSEIQLHSSQPVLLEA